jgi:hypothetical protein
VKVLRQPALRDGRREWVEIDLDTRRVLRSYTDHPGGMPIDEGNRVFRWKPGAAAAEAESDRLEGAAPLRLRRGDRPVTGETVNGGRLKMKR